jgi:hypothetical protein
MHSGSFNEVAKRIVKLGNPIVSPARAIPEFFAPVIKDDHDTIRLLDNEHVRKGLIEDKYISLNKNINPIFLTPFTARDLLMNAWIDDDRVFNKNNATVVTVGSSIKFDSMTDAIAVNDVAKEFATKLPVTKSGAYAACAKPSLYDHVFFIIRRKGIEKIPACVEANNKSLTRLDLSWNDIVKIENIDTLTALQKLNLSHNRIEKIENMDTLCDLCKGACFPGMRDGVSIQV